MTSASQVGVNAACNAERSSQVRTLACDEPVVSTLAVWPWVLLGQRYGIAMREICDATGASEGELRDPGGLVSQRRANRAAELVIGRAGESAAMQAAQAVDPGHFALVELVARSAPTVCEGMARTCEVLPLVHRSGRLSCEVLPDRAFVHWRCSPEIELHPAYVELMFAVLIQGVRRETGCSEIHYASVWFEHAAPLDPSAHQQMLGPVRFAMPETRVELSQETLQLRLLRASATAHSSALQVVDEAIRETEASLVGRQAS
jgi:Arabinose-binding domain of AraC transcription regulator, N-term